MSKKNKEAVVMPDTIAVWRFHPDKADEWLHGGWSEDHDRKTTEYRRADLRPTREQIEAMVVPLEWKCFDAWTWWAETDSVVYSVNDRNGPWRASFSSEPSGIFSAIEIEDNTEAACKAACERHYNRRVLAALGYEPDQ